MSLDDTDRARRKDIPARTRAVVAQRLGLAAGESAAVSCHYCGSLGVLTWFFGTRSRFGWPASSLEWDHVVPLASGGSNDDPENIVLACRPCNRSKGALTVAEWSPVAAR